MPDTTLLTFSLSLVLALPLSLLLLTSWILHLRRHGHLHGHRGMRIEDAFILLLLLWVLLGLLGLLLRLLLGRLIVHLRVGVLLLVLLRVVHEHRVLILALVVILALILILILVLILVLALLQIVTMRLLHLAMLSMLPHRRHMSRLRAHRRREWWRWLLWHLRLSLRLRLCVLLMRRPGWCLLLLLLRLMLTLGLPRTISQLSLPLLILHRLRHSCCASLSRCRHRAGLRTRHGMILQTTPAGK